jgi:hypothetical protein
VRAVKRQKTTWTRPGCSSVQVSCVCLALLLTAAKTDGLSDHVLSMALVRVYMGPPSRIRTTLKTIVPRLQCSRLDPLTWGCLLAHAAKLLDITQRWLIFLPKFRLASFNVSAAMRI